MPSSPTTADPTSTDPTPDELLALATTAAQGAAALLVDGLAVTRALVETKSSGTDMVTEMDHASEQHIARTILEARPDDAVVGEEGTDTAGGSGVQWFVDPIDGTTNYLYGHPGFAVSVAAAVHGEVVAGVVADPLHDDLFTATRGGGAHRNGRRIAVTDEQALSNALVATGFSYLAPRRVAQMRVLERFIGDIRDIRRMGAAAVDLCAVACGRVDAFYERSLRAWDYAAGVLIAEEAGAVVGDLDGGRDFDSFVLAATPALFGPLRERLLDAGAATA